MSGQEGRGKYGFDRIELPPAVPERRPPRPTPETLDQAVQAGRSLGFVARDPAVEGGPDVPKETAPPVRRKPGPKRREPQDKLSIPGPKRVIDAFRGYCAEEDLTLWQGLERLLEAGGRTPR